MERERQVEAREWIKNNKNEYLFASNVFEGKEDILEFVDELYSIKGVQSVSVTGILDESYRIKEEGGEYADTLIVECSSDCNYKELMKLIHEHKPDEFSEIETDTFRLWWD